MPVRPRPVIASALAAIAIVACSTAPAAPAPAAAGPRTWKQTMHAVDAEWSTLKKELDREPIGNLKQAAAMAERAAALVRLGYGEFEDTRVPRFADYARHTESWLLQIALEAGQGHGELARDLAHRGEAEHCTRCHDANEKASRR